MGWPNRQASLSPPRAMRRREPFYDVAAVPPASDLRLRGWRVGGELKGTSGAKVEGAAVGTGPPIARCAIRGPCLSGFTVPAGPGQTLLGAPTIGKGFAFFRAGWAVLTLGFGRDQDDLPCPGLGGAATRGAPAQAQPMLTNVPLGASRVAPGWATDAGGFEQPAGGRLRARRLRRRHTRCREGSGPGGTGCSHCPARRWPASVPWSSRFDSTRSRSARLKNDATAGSAEPFRSAMRLIGELCWRGASSLLRSPRCSADCGLFQPSRRSLHAWDHWPPIASIVQLVPGTTTRTQLRHAWSTPAAGLVSSSRKRETK